MVLEKYFKSCYYFFYYLVEKKNKILFFFPLSLSVVCPLSSFPFSLLLFSSLFVSNLIYFISSFLHFFISLFLYLLIVVLLFLLSNFTIFIFYRTIVSLHFVSIHLISNYFISYHFISFHFIPFHIFSDCLQCESHLPRTSSRRPINRRNEIFFKCSKRNFFRI